MAQAPATKQVSRENSTAERSAVELPMLVTGDLKANYSRMTKKSHVIGGTYRTK
jgi:hypothetical protein